MRRPDTLAVKHKSGRMRQLRLCLLLLTGLSSPVAGPVGLLLAFLPLMFPVRSPAAMAALRPRYAAPGAYR